MLYSMGLPKQTAIYPEPKIRIVQFFSLSGKVYDDACMANRISRDLVRRVMAAIGSRGGKRSLETMTAEERSARAKKASLAAAKKRTAERLARGRAKKRTRK